MVANRSPPRKGPKPEAEDMGDRPRPLRPRPRNEGEGQFYHDVEGGLKDGAKADVMARGGNLLTGGLLM
jgi:hypothetical protein